MKTLSRDDFEFLVADATIIEKDRHGAKVLKAADGSYIKLFRRKHLLTTALLRPYARRFADNAARLRSQGIPCVEVIALAYCPSVGRHLVRYRPLPGRTLRDTATESGLDRYRLAHFLADLHRRGVYFRSIHLGNVIVNPETGALGLIDVADMSFRRAPLSCSRRIRNFRHMLRYREDVESLRQAGFDFFVADYVEATGPCRMAGRLRKELSLLFATI